MKNDNSYLTREEISNIIGRAKKPGLRFTVDLYLLDYIKHCFLEDEQLSAHINKLNSALNYIGNEEIKRGVHEVIKSLECVQSEYKEYVEDMRVLANGDYPNPRGSGQSIGSQ